MSLLRSISGLFKWRQFEPEVILLAVGWYLRFSLSYWASRNFWPSAVLRPCHPLAMGAALRPGNGAEPAQTPQRDERSRAGRRELRPGQRPVALLVPGRGFLGCDLGFSAHGHAGTRRLPNASWPKPWAGRITPRPRVIHTDGHEPTRLPLRS